MSKSIENDEFNLREDFGEDFDDMEFDKIYGFYFFKAHLNIFRLTTRSETIKKSYKKGKI